MVKPRIMFFLSKVIFMKEIFSYWILWVGDQTALHVQSDLDPQKFNWSRLADYRRTAFAKKKIEMSLNSTE